MSGTLISELNSENNSINTDNDSIQNILNEINGPQQQQQQQPPQYQRPPAVVRNAPNPNTVIQHATDNYGPTAHMIGMEHPTNADFASMMQETPQPMYRQQYNYKQQPQQQQQQPPPPKNYNSIFSEMKTPIFVTLLFFVLNLPFITVLISHYLPSFVKATGDLNTYGLLLKSILAGVLYWSLPFFGRLINNNN